MRRAQSCLTTQLAPVTHYNWRLQSSRDEIVWLIDVRIPWTKSVPTMPLLSYVALRQDLLQPVHCQRSELDMTAPPQEGKVATLMPLGELVLNMGGLLTITMAPHPGWPEPFQKHSHSVTHNRGDQIKALQVEKSGINQCWHQHLCLGHKPRWTKQLDQEWEGREYHWVGAAYQIGGYQVKALQVEKSFRNQCWYQAIRPRMRMQRLSSSRCGLANGNIGRHSNDAQCFRGKALQVEKSGINRCWHQEIGPRMRRREYHWNGCGPIK